MKKHLINFLLILFLVSGIGLLLYPTVSELWNSYHQSQAISNYENKAEALPIYMEESRKLGLFIY